MYQQGPDTPESIDLYGVLGLTHEATLEQIKSEYKQLARRFHPDKLKCNPQSKNQEAANPQEDRFSAISAAYEVLKDPLRKAKYDFERGYLTNSKDIENLHRIDAEKAVDLMRLTFDIKRRTEFARQGLIIDDAFYGSMHHEEKRVNVTRPLQCMVQGSRLVIPKGDPKYLLIGFYDPCPLEPKVLSIKYYFRSRLHEITISDTDKLLMPLKSHLIKRKHHTANANGKPVSPSSEVSPAMSALLLLGTVASVSSIVSMYFVRQHRLQQQR